jgi:predicted transposase YbfD/YdcC
LVQHHTGIVRKQVRVRTKSNEITAMPLLLTGRALANSVITVDAHRTQRTSAEQILAQRGH